MNRSIRPVKPQKLEKLQKKDVQESVEIDTLRIAKESLISPAKDHRILEFKNYTNENDKMPSSIYSSNFDQSYNISSDFKSIIKNVEEMQVSSLTQSTNLNIMIYNTKN